MLRNNVSDDICGGVCVSVSFPIDLSIVSVCVYCVYVTTHTCTRMCAFYFSIYTSGVTGGCMTQNYVHRGQKQTTNGLLLNTSKHHYLIPVSYTHLDVYKRQVTAGEDR